MELPAAQKSKPDSMNTDSDYFTSVSRAEEEGSDEEYCVGFACDVLEEVQKRVPSR